MEFDHLKGFYHVAKLGSFTVAAERLYLTQPAISHQIKALEGQLGERLFDRIGRSIKLTAAGHTLYEQVGEILEKLEDLERTMAEIQAIDRGSLALGASDTTSMYRLPRLLKKFVTAYPKVDLSISSRMSHEVARQVMEHEVDLGLVTLFPLGPKLGAIPLFEEQMVCIVPADHPLAARKSVDPAEIASHPLILLERGSVTREKIETFFLKAGCTHRPFIELTNFEIMKRFVVEGLGVALVPEPVARGSSDGFRVLGLRPALSVEVDLIFRQDRKLSRAARAFLAMAQEFFKASPREPVEAVETRKN